MDKKRERATDYDKLPLILDVSHIRQIMGISRVSAYELVHSAGFPLIRHGRLIKVSKRAFFEWLERGGLIAPTNDAAATEAGKCSDTENLL